MGEICYKNFKFKDNNNIYKENEEEKSMNEIGMIDKICNLLNETTDDEEIVNVLKLLNEKFKNKQNEILYQYFMDFDIFGLLISFLNSENIRICHLGFMTIINFTRTNEDFVQMFLENGLLIIIHNIIKNPETNIFLLTESISILLNILKFNDIYLRRCFFVLPLERLFNYVKLNDIDLTRVCIKYSVNILQNSKMVGRNLKIIEFFSYVLSSDILKNDVIIEYVIYGITIYTKSSDFSSSQLLKLDIPKQLIDLLQNPEKLYILQLLRLFGLLIIKKVIKTLDFHLMLPYLNSNNSNVQSEGYWSLSCAIIENIITDKTELINFFLNSINECKCFDVTVESSHAIISLLKLLNDDEMILFLKNDIFNLLSRFLFLTSYPSIIIDVLKIIFKYYDIITKNGNKELIYQKLENSNCIQQIQELCFNEDENISTLAKSLQKFLL